MAAGQPPAGASDRGAAAGPAQSSDSVALDACQAVHDNVLPGCPKATAEEVGMDPRPLDELHETYRRAIQNNELPGMAYAILRDGKVARASALGVRDLETQEPWRCDTMCRLYSMTKSIAVVGLMSLIEEGLVALEDPVSKYVPAFASRNLQVAHNEENTRKVEENKAPSQEVKVIHLLTHSSGLSYGPAMGDESQCPGEESYRQLMERVDRGEVRDLEQYCNELAELPLRFEPGERWEYSYSIDVIGRIMEVASGKRLDVFLRERVLEPLRLLDTTFSLPEGQIGRLASFYRRRPDTNSNGDLDVVDRAPSSHWAEERTSGRVLSAGGTVGTVAGGLVSTLNDFARLCLMIQNEGELDGVRVLRPETVRMMSRNLLPEVTGKQDSWCLETAGLGFGVLGSVAVQHPDANWYDVPGEIGWGGLAGTAWAVDHRERVVVVTVCQVMYELWIDEEARKAARLALGYVPPPEEPSAEEASPAKAEAPASAPTEALPPSAEAAAESDAPAAAAPEAVAMVEATPAELPVAPVTPVDKENLPPPATPPVDDGGAPAAEVCTPTEKGTKRSASEAMMPVDTDDETPEGKKPRLGHSAFGNITAAPEAKLVIRTPLGERILQPPQPQRLQPRRQGSVLLNAC